MYRREHRHQLSFEDFFLPFGGKLSGDNRWIKLAELIPWDELEYDYAAHFCKGFGAPAKPGPTTRRLYRSIQTAKYRQPAVVRV